MNFQTSSEQNESQGTVSVSLKGIPTAQGQAERGGQSTGH